MKTICLIFSLYLNILATLPCGDKADCAATDIELTQDHREHEHETETCTPFCICSCCGGLVNISDNTELDFSLREFVSLPLIYVNAALSEGNQSIWQPPKVSA